jgi:DNA mismatch repair protein MutS
MVPTLSSGAPTAARAGRRPSPPPAPTDQLGLFAPAGPHPVVERLRETDVNSLTPLAALQLLAELAERARGI